MNGYSPWMDAAGATQNLSNAFNNVVLGLAQLKFQKQLRDQLTQMQMFDLMSQYGVRKAQEERLNAEAAFNRALVDAADRAAAAYRRPESDFLTQGPTQEAAEALRLNRIMEQVLRSAALSGDLPSLLGHNIPANSVSQNFITGEITPGMISVGPGETMFDPRGRMLAQGVTELGPRQQLIQPIVENGVPRFNVAATNPLFATPPSAGGVTGEVRPTDISSMVGNVLSAINSPYADTNSPVFKESAALLPVLLEEFKSRLPKRTNAPSGGKPLDPDTARKILQQAGGDKNKAREIARQMGYSF